MATKKKPDKSKATLIKAIKTTITKSAVLPILEDVHLTGDRLEMTDLETFVSMPFTSAVKDVCVPAKLLTDALALMEQAEIIQHPDHEYVREHFLTADGKIYFGNEEELKYEFRNFIYNWQRANQENEEAKEPTFAEWMQSDNAARELKEIPKPELTPTFAVDVIEGKRKVRLTGENPDNFPVHRLHSSGLDFVQIGEITPDIFDKLCTAARFVTTDGIRPEMLGIYCGEDICGTDAHRLYRHKLTEPFMESFILPTKALNILGVWGGTWQVFGAVQYKRNKEGKLIVEIPKQKVYDSKAHRTVKVPIMDAVAQPIFEEMLTVAFINEEHGVFVESRVIDAKFPNYNVVIPQDNPNCKLFCDPGKLREELKFAIKYSNRTTSMVTLSINGETTISSQDIDFGYEYQNMLEFTEHKGDNIEIAFNGKFLDEIIAEIPTTECVKFHFWSPTKCTIINDEFLLMPLMLNQ